MTLERANKLADTKAIVYSIYTVRIAGKDMGKSKHFGYMARDCFGDPIMVRLDGRTSRWEDTHEVKRPEQILFYREQINRMEVTK